MKAIVVAAAGHVVDRSHVIAFAKERLQRDLLVEFVGVGDPGDELSRRQGPRFPAAPGGGLQRWLAPHR
ncbi:hypothetical protein [Pseudonocardia sp.]|uniref:hypothetical protein n=1 Tax=Pseudonocardia sp. TaxID=60912 RepID=UPI0031FBDCEC